MKAYRELGVVLTKNEGPGASGQFRRHPRRPDTHAALCSLQGDAAFGELPWLR